ncbi:14384_t:CDS:2, partial [Cetraspora pellucida]
HKGRTVEIPILNDEKKRLEEPREEDTWSSDSGDTFDELTYDEEELNEAEVYYSKKMPGDENKLYYNPWKNEASLTIYLTNVDEIPTEENESELAVSARLEKFTQVETLNEEERNEKKKIVGLEIVESKENCGNWSDYEEESEDDAYDSGYSHNYHLGAGEAWCDLTEEEEYGIKERECMYLLENILADPEEENHLNERLQLPLRNEEQGRQIEEEAYTIDDYFEIEAEE